MYKMHGRNFN